MTTAVAISSALRLMQGVPFADKLELLSPSARDLLKQSTPVAHHFVVYSEKELDPFPSGSELRVSDTHTLISFLHVEYGFRVPSGLCV